MEIDLKKLEEKYSKNKPTFSLKELLLCIALVVAGCVVFLAMPDEMGILGWILFTIGAFLNVVGIFRLAAMVPEQKSERERKVATLISVVVAALAQFLGLLYLYNSDGTGKSIAIATLSLCISLGLIIYAVDFDDSKMKPKIKIICKIITVLLIAIIIFLIIRDDFSDSSVYVGTILLIEAIISGKTGFKSKN